MGALFYVLQTFVQNLEYIRQSNPFYELIPHHCFKVITWVYTHKTMQIIEHGYFADVIIIV